MSETITVLLVDEDTEVLELTETFLERTDEDLDVRTETSIEDALDRVESESFDCVVSDYSMPGMAGAQFLDAVHEREPGLPFFFFTGKDSQEVARATADADLAGHVQKGTGTDRYADLAGKIRAAVEG